MPLQGLLIIDYLLLHLLNGFGIAMRGKEAVEMGEVFACGFALHTQVAVAEVVIGGGLQLVGSHAKNQQLTITKPQTNRSNMRSANCTLAKRG